MIIDNVTCRKVLVVAETYALEHNSIITVTNSRIKELEVGGLHEGSRLRVTASRIDHVAVGPMENGALELYRVKTHKVSVAPNYKYAVAWSTIKISECEITDGEGVIIGPVLVGKIFIHNSIIQGNKPYGLTVQEITSMCFELRGACTIDIGGN